MRLIDADFVTDFQFDDLNDFMNSNDSMNVIVFVAGYVAKKIITKTQCSECCELATKVGRSMLS